MISRHGRRILVTRKSTGLGSDLISVLGAIYFAGTCGREVMVDWRCSRYLPDRTANLFPLLFDVPSRVEGVVLSAAPSPLVDSDLPQPILYSEDWPFRRYHRDMLRQSDREERCLVVTRPMHHLPDPEVQRSILERIRPVERLREHIRQFSAENFSGKTVIGVHIRYGSGERLGRRHHFIRQGLDAIYGICLEACRRLGFPDAHIFLCTDSEPLRNYFVDRHPDLIVFPSRLAEQGPLHVPAFGLRGAEEAVQEMWLLSHCQFLVYNPSWFSHYARIMGNFGQPPVNIDGRSSYGTIQLYDERVRWLGIPWLADRWRRRLIRTGSRIIRRQN